MYFSSYLERAVFPRAEDTGARIVDNEGFYKDVPWTLIFMAQPVTDSLQSGSTGLEETEYNKEG
jgi:hypothetical protein